MCRGTTTIAAVAAASALLAPGAQAGTVALDHSCYVEETEMVATGSDFVASSSLTLSGDGAFTTATTDPLGAFTSSIGVPINPSIGAKLTDLVTYTLNVEDFANPTQNTSVHYRVANFAFETSKGTKSPRARRTWWFSGFPTGATIYGHFRFRGQTKSNYRFGKATGPCGMLKRTAPGLPVRATQVRSGTWTVQIDMKRTYSRRTRPALTANTTLFKTFR